MARKRFQRIVEQRHEEPQSRDEIWRHSRTASGRACFDDTSKIYIDRDSSAKEARRRQRSLRNEDKRQAHGPLMTATKLTVVLGVDYVEA